LFQTRYKNIDKKQTMKKKLLSLGLAIFIGGFSLKAQNNLQSSEKYTVNKYAPTHTITPPSRAKIDAEDLERDKNGLYYRIGVSTDANISPSFSGLWTTLSNGDRIWQLKVKATGAEALSFLFSTFKLYDNASFWVQDNQGNPLYRTLTKNDVLDHFQQHVELCFGDEMVLNLLEPKGTRPSEFLLDQIMYDYRSTGNPNIQKINESDACQVNVNCSPEGDNWKDEKRGVARVLVVDPAGQGYCSGTLVNNTAKDCKPYFLTALHCGVDATTANFNQWKFYFGYEAPTCTNPTTTGTLASHVITGCVKKATSNCNGGDTGSDFLLVQMGSAANEAATINTLRSASFNAYWNGWDANNTASTSGVSIHHPSGDIKKISAYTSALTSTTWGGVAANSHWQLVWAATTNGHGVTEGGSSGSPLFTYNGGNSRVVGTLTGGSSYCNATSSPDLYGKMSYHWQSNTTAGNIPLKNFLDPGNTGVLVLDGSANPCSAAGINEEELLNAISIFPNPVNDQLTIDLSTLKNESVSIYIYDMTGKLLKSIYNQSGNLVNVNTASFAKGMYQVVFKTATTESVQKVIKQ
jgi:lysyl endopeptidase